MCLCVCVCKCLCLDACVFPVGSCGVCGGPDSTHKNQIVFCDRCNVAVHQARSLVVCASALGVAVIWLPQAVSCVFEGEGAACVVFRCVSNQFIYAPTPAPSNSAATVFCVFPRVSGCVCHARGVRRCQQGCGVACVVWLAAPSALIPTHLAHTHTQSALLWPLLHR